MMDAFWAKVQIGAPDECWPWTGSRRGGGTNRYGRFGKEGLAHRIALEHKIGRSLSDGMIACHTCDNPICCNPNHLYEGTRSQNAHDAFKRGQWTPGDQKGSANGNSRLSEADVRAIRKRIENGETNVAIARSYPVTHATISNIRRGKFWAGV